MPTYEQAKAQVDDAARFIDASVRETFGQLWHSAQAGSSEGSGRLPRLHRAGVV